MTQKLPNLEGAACATPQGRDLFADVTTSSTITQCRKICASCPVQRTCLQWGVLHEHEGMWGGLLSDERETERRRHHLRLKQPTVSMWVVLQQAAAAKRAGAVA